MNTSPSCPGLSAAKWQSFGIYDSQARVLIVEVNYKSISPDRQRGCCAAAMDERDTQTADKGGRQAVNTSDTYQSNKKRKSEAFNTVGRWTEREDDGEQCNWVTVYLWKQLSLNNVREKFSCLHCIDYWLKISELGKLRQFMSQFNYKAVSELRWQNEWKNIWKGWFQGEEMGLVTSEKYNYNHSTESVVSASLLNGRVTGGSEAKMSVVCHTYWCVKKSMYSFLQFIVPL